MSWEYMGVVWPSMYHWSPLSARAGIVRHGLKPTCETSTSMRPPLEGLGAHYDVENEVYCFKAVCLAPSAMQAWALSGDISARPGDRWDLWEVRLDIDDQVYPMPGVGVNIEELRVANGIPKSRVLWVAERLVTRRWVNPPG